MKRTPAKGRPWLLVLIVGLALAALAPRPALDNSVQAWFPRSHGPLSTYHDFQATFGADEVVVVSVQARDGERLLRFVAELSEELGEDPAVERVLSVSTLYEAEVMTLTEPGLGGLENLKTVGWAFGGPLNRELQLYDPVAQSATLYLLLGPGSSEQRIELSSRLEQARSRGALVGCGVALAGQPLVNVELDRASRDVDRVSMPVLVVVCALLLLVSLRSVRLSLILLVPVGLGVFAADGLLGLTGATSNLIVAVVKPLLFVLLLASGFHVLVAYADARRQGAGRVAAAWRAAAQKTRPVLLALGTTAAGFSSLALSNIAPIRSFGLLSAAGLAVGAALVLVLLPGLLSVAAGDSVPHAGEGVARLCAWLVDLGDRAPRRWVAAAVFVIALGAWAAWGLQPQPHAILYFPPTHPLRVDYERLEAAGRGLAHLEAVVSSRASLVDDAVTLERLDAFATAASKLEGVRGCVSLPLLLREAGYRTARVDRIPASFLLKDIIARRSEEFAPFASADGRRLRFSFAIDTLGPRELEALEVALRRLFRGAAAEQGDLASGMRPGLSPGLSLTLTGSYPLLLGTQRSLLTTLWQSLLTTAVLMQLVLLVALRSWRLTLAAVLPNALPVAAGFLVMSLLDLPLDVGTSMTAAVALGIAMDDTIHFLYAWREGDLEACALGTGRALAFTTLVIAAGFASLLSSGFGPTRNFGVLCAAALVVALIGDLVILPAVLRLVAPRSAGPAAGQTP